MRLKVRRVTLNPPSPLLDDVLFNGEVNRFDLRTPARHDGQRQAGW